MDNSSFCGIHRTESYFSLCLLNLLCHFNSQIFETSGISFSSGVDINGNLVILLDMSVHGKSGHGLNRIYNFAALLYQACEFGTVYLGFYTLFLGLGHFEFVFHYAHFFHKSVEKFFDKLNGVYFVFVSNFYNCGLCSETEKAAFRIFNNVNAEIFSCKSEFFGSRFYGVVNRFSGKISFHKRPFLLYFLF